MGENLEEHKKSLAKSLLLKYACRITRYVAILQRNKPKDAILNHIKTKLHTQDRYSYDDKLAFQWAKVGGVQPYIDALNENGMTNPPDPNYLLKQFGNELGLSIDPGSFAQRTPGSHMKYSKQNPVFHR